VAVTTDKCYENKEWLHSYREEDPMGGYDPYSSSKGAAELVLASYRRSFFGDNKLGIHVASARAGNVIGGGDWALDRIIPDCIRSLKKGDAIVVRNKKSTRPWQHVLEPLSGYLWLGACLAKPELTEYKDNLTSAFNFGPELSSHKTVEALVNEVLKHWPGEWLDNSDINTMHEAKFLNLATDKAFHLLGWKPTWSFERTIVHTVGWYSHRSHSYDSSLAQIARFKEDALAKNATWAKN
jgi:CDP-glucose 4,6-dehydratase